jgi:aminopeptidase N
MKRPRFITAAAALVLGAAVFSRLAFPGHAPDSREYDVISYALRLTVIPESMTIAGRNEITLVTAAPASSIRLDAGSATLRIDSVLSGGRPLGFVHAGNILEVRLSAAVRASATVTLDVYYRGRSAFDGRYDSGGILFTKSSTGYTVGTSSEPNFARLWWPCNDRPSDKALFSLRCTVPRGMTVVSNGRLLSRTVEGAGETFEWGTKTPIATYLVFLGASDYLVSTGTMTLPDGRPLDLAWYVFPEDSAKAAEDFRNTREILTFFSMKFVPYPFASEKFAVAEVDSHLTMENQTIVAFERGMITGDRRNENTFVHEIAHQWWGDLVTPVDWHHTWLNEGFATYSEALYVESRKGPEAYRKYIDVLMDQPAGFYAGSVIGRDEDAFWDSFGPAVYYKGALTLHMLRRMMGDGAFFDALRSYLQDPRLAYANASTDDFRTHCEREYGSDLRWFFDQWVYAARDSADRPCLTYRWEERPSGPDYILRVSVRQAAPAWRLPFSILVHRHGGQEEYPVVDSLAAQDFVFHGASPADSVLLDPGRDLFMTVRRGVTE